MLEQVLHRTDNRLTDALHNPGVTDRERRRGHPPGDGDDHRRRQHPEPDPTLVGPPGWRWR